MTQIHVDTERLAHMCWQLDWHVSTLHNGAAGLVRAVYGAPSYNGQYGPWLWNLAMEGSDPLHRMADHLGGLLEWLRRVTDAFVEADELEIIGVPAWAALIRDMVESGDVPATVSSLYEWKGSNVRPPWIDEATWQAMSPDQQLEILERARLAYEQQLARIDRLRTPPWANNEEWLWRVGGVNPNLMGIYDQLEPGGAQEFQTQLEQVRQLYEQKWADFLASQSIYKFGVGDDLSEAFLIYLFGLEGAAEYGVGRHAANNMRLLARPDLRASVGPADQYIDLSDPSLPFSEEFPRSNPHFNLCGQLTIAATLGIDPIDGLARFSELLPDYAAGDYTDGSRILGDPRMGTSPQDLSDFMELYDWTGEPIGYASDTQAWVDRPPTLAEISNRLERGQAVIALVALDTRSTYLTPNDVPGDAAHWVSIVQTIQTRSGEEIVRVYNPFMNREEWYTWQDMQDSWQLGSKLDSQGDPLGPNYRGVIGTPPPELAWLPQP